MMAKESFKIDYDNGKSYDLYLDYEKRFYVMSVHWSEKYGTHMIGNKIRISKANYERMKKLYESKTGE